MTTSFFFRVLLSRSRRSLAIAGDITVLPKNGDSRSYSVGSAASNHADRRPGPLAVYKGMVEHGKLKYDRYQENAASELEGLLVNLDQYEKDMEDYHEKLATWEGSREAKRQKLLLEEAEVKQNEGVWGEANYGSYFLEKLLSRRKRRDVEPGVGKMVSYLNREKKLDSLVGRRPVAPVAPKGIYLYGNVGSGKTMLMDLFFGATEGVVKHRRRFHFHEAMLEIHEYMHDVWKNQVERSSRDSNVFSWIFELPFDQKVKEWLIGEERYKQELQMKHILSAVADKFLVDRKFNKVGASVLCFDEIQTVDVFAIVALSGIVSRLLSTGTVLVATSNRLPKDLNQDGMQWEIFEKFLFKLEENCRNILMESDIDYRLLIPEKEIEQIHYFWPNNDDVRQEYESAWREIINSFGEVSSSTIPVMFGRFLEVRESCNGVARFDFEYLCGRPAGAADYIAISRHYHTVFISDIPVMSMRNRDKARRFITLIDELYNRHCILFGSAECSIQDLFQGTEEGALFDLESYQFESEIEGGKLRRDVHTAGNVSSVPAVSGLLSLLSGQEEMFAFRRAVSRLIEMQTPLYRESAHLHHPYFNHSQPPASSSLPASLSPSNY